MNEHEIELVYAARKAGVCRPEGKRDAGGRWLPSDREDAGDLTGRIYPPSRRWGWSYWRAAHARAHLRALAEREPAYWRELVARARAWSERTSWEITV